MKRMKQKISSVLACLIIICTLFSCKSNTVVSKSVESTTNKLGFFEPDKDLLLANFDCKTDVDDLHTVAAFATLMSNPTYSQIYFHAVAGAYGIQEGLYVPPNKLFQLAFNDNWTDAHKNMNEAVQKVNSIVLEVFSAGGDLWIAEAGQSDFSAQLIQFIISESPSLNPKERIHLIQHSGWNEKVTSPKSLAFVKKHIDYQKIPDGNAVGNGTPGFRSPTFNASALKLDDPRLRSIWQLAIDLGNQYNGKEGRYTNEAVENGGLDFSDLSETCWILGLQEITDVDMFFQQMVK